MNPLPLGTNAGTNLFFSTFTIAEQPSGGRVSVCWVVQSIGGIMPSAVSAFILLSAATTFACVKFGPAAFRPSTSMVALIQPYVDDSVGVSPCLSIQVRYSSRLFGRGDVSNGTNGTRT